LARRKTMKKTFLKLTVLTLAALAALALAACGDAEAGPAGAPGANGTQGLPGQDGDGVVPGTVTVSGSPMVNSSVTAVYDNPGNSPQLYYRWYANGDYTASIGSSAAYTPVVAVIGKTLTCRVYAVGFTGYNESAPTAAVAAFAPPSPTTLTTSSAGGNLSGIGEVDWYKFDAVSTSSYTITWEDYGTNGTTADIYVAAYKADGTSLFTNDDFSPGTAISGYDGTVYVRVMPYSTTGTWLGTYNIWYTN
jgi:hypothetical protein